MGNRCWKCAYYDDKEDKCDLANLEFEFGGQNCKDYIPVVERSKTNLNGEG